MKTSLAFLLLSLAAALAAKSYHGHQVLEISAVNKEQTDALESMLHSNTQLDVWRIAHAPNTQVDVHVTPEQQAEVTQFLQAHSIPYRVKIPDVEVAIQQQLSGVRSRKDARDVDFNEYNTLDQIDQYLQDLADTNPLVSRLNVGTSYEGLPMYSLQISTDPDAGRPSLVINGGTNPQEWISTAVVLNFINWLVTGYAVDEEITLLLDNLDFYIMPVFNVDGYVYTFDEEEGDRLWRKTRSPNEGSECVGTDPNRNFGLEWGGDDNPCSNNYAGAGPFSEVEVQSVMDFVEGLQDVRAYLPYHSYGQVMLFPYGYTSDPINDYDEVSTTLQAAAEAAEAVDGKSYRVVNVNQAFGTIRGSSVDYTYGALDITYSVGIDLRDEGEYGFLLPADQIAPCAEESFAALLVIANRILETVRQ